MAFFKPSVSAKASKSTARLDVLIWTLIYAGLLTMVLGIALIGYEAALAWSLIAAGGAVTAVGGLLIYLRSRLDHRT